MPLGLEIKSEDYYQDDDLYYEKQEDGIISANKVNRVLKMLISVHLLKVVLLVQIIIVRSYIR